LDYTDIVKVELQNWADKYPNIGIEIYMDAAQKFVGKAFLGVTNDNAEMPYTIMANLVIGGSSRWEVLEKIKQAWDVFNTEFFSAMNKTLVAQNQSDYQCIDPSKMFESWDSVIESPERYEDN